VKILFCTAGFSQAINALRKYLPKGFEVVARNENIPFTEQVRDFEVLIPAMAKITREVMLAAPKLKLIQQCGVGLEGVDIEAARELGIYVANVPGANAISVAEHVIFLMLALARKFNEASKSFREGKIGEPAGHEIYGKTLGIIGLGRSGTELAKRAKALGMRVLAIKKNPNSELARKLELDFLGGPGDLDFVLENSDFISIHVPLTSETRNLIGEREFKLMKKTAYLINIARGPIVNREALYKALKERWIAGAALDVFWEEPPNPDDPLFKLDNIIVTPHVAGVTHEAYDRIAKEVAENIVRVSKGLSPKHRVV